MSSLDPEAPYSCCSTQYCCLEEDICSDVELLRDTRVPVITSAFTAPGAKINRSHTAVKLNDPLKKWSHTVYLLSLIKMNKFYKRPLNALINLKNQRDLTSTSSHFVHQVMFVLKRNKKLLFFTQMWQMCKESCEMIKQCATKQGRKKEPTHFITNSRE